MFNPFAKEKVRNRRTEHPKRRVDFESQLLHENCSAWARECWKLWNRGFPVARILHHYPDTDSGNYFIKLDLETYFPILNETDILGAPDFVSTPVLSELVAFLVDLIRLEKASVSGLFALSWTDELFHFETDFQGAKFCLIPLLTHLEGKSTGEQNLLSLAKLAAMVVFPGKKNTFKQCKSIQEILQKLEPLNFRKDKQSEGTGTLLVDVENSPHVLWLNWKGDYFRVTPNPHGFWLVSPKPERHAKGISINLNITPYPSSVEKNPLTEHALTWIQQPKLWMNGARSFLSRDILAGMCAEEQHAENSGYRYTVVESDFEKGVASIRIEQKNGTSNAHDLWDAALSEREMLVALNRKESVFDWNDNDVWNLDGIDEKDPFLLMVSSVNSRKIPDRGFLKLASVPHRALMRRKTTLIRTGVCLESIRHLQHPINYEGSIPNWRLSKRASIMTLQGPPGTGKTWTATNIVNDLLQENPHARILVCAKEHLALDHLAERIRDQLPSHFDVVRINKSEGQLMNPISQQITPKGVAKKIIKQLGLGASALKEVGRTATWVDDVALRACSVVCTTTLDKTMESLQRTGMTFDFSIIEEAGKCYPSEMIGPASVAMNTLLIGDHMQLPPFELIEIENNLEFVFKEALRQWSDKRANKMARAMIELTSKHYEREQLDVAPHAEQAKTWLQPFQALHRTTKGDMLKNQWRMFRSLSDTIGRTFYGKPFTLQKKDAYKGENLPSLFGKVGNRLIFVDIEDGVEKISNKSLANQQEAITVSTLLTELLENGHDAIAITPYNGQVDEIRGRIPDKFRDNVRTVDGFQGKEADFILLSLVRKNQRTGASRRWGFFRDPRRINVAFSRAREGLIVVSSQKHIEQTDWLENEEHLLTILNEIQQHGSVVQGK